MTVHQCLLYICANATHLVDNVDASSLVLLDDRSRCWTPGSLDDLDSLVNDDLRVLGVGRRRNRGEEREVDGARGGLISIATGRGLRNTGRTRAWR
jgi:hypothetical protein